MIHSSDQLHGVAEFYSEHGYGLVADVLSRSQVDRLSTVIEDVRKNDANDSSVSNSSGVYALRNLTEVVPEVSELLTGSRLAEIVTAVLGPNAFVVRSTLFDKTDGANWGVFWHQDLSIAVQERHEVDGFTAWTRKAGVPCVQPPADIMRRILAVRLSLDDCDQSNGALRVLPGSHRRDRLNTAQTEAILQQTSEVICEVPAGGAVLMNPLTLHSSLPMQVSGHRRVIHLEFAGFELPSPLQWRFRIPVIAQR